MSTNAAIGMKTADGSVRAVRLNYDGYVGHAGAILGGWYTTAEQVEALLALGELSEINETPETCVAYRRDMREKFRPPFRFETVDEYRYRGKGLLAAQYLYLYDDGKWRVYGLSGEPDWIDLEVEVGKPEK